MLSFKGLRMFFHFKQLSRAYYHFWLSLVNFKNKAHLIPLNFHNAWWSILWQQKKYAIYILAAETVDNIFYTLIPLLIGWIIATQQFNYFFMFIAAWLAAITIEYSALYYSSLLQMQTIHSLLYYAHQFFLTVDPIYHTTRSRGKIVGKIDRGVHAYEDLLDIIAFDILPTVVGLATVVISFLKFNTFLGVLTSLMICAIGIVNVFLQFLSTQAFEPEVIAASDTLSSMSLENLSQIQYIRACFASNQMNGALNHTNREMMNIGGTSLIAFSALTFLTRLAYIGSILVLGFYLLALVKDGSVSVIMGTALLMTYINGSYEIMRVGKKIKKFLKSTTRIKDLFNFIQTFGNQTFPVLSTPNHAVALATLKERASTLSLQVENLHFDYHAKAKIFENHRLDMVITKEQPNKLYGIIGPSGIGKTTLISILGGQLHPDTGTVSIQGIDIYTVDDTIRQQLVALQGQVASSLRGTIRYNLLFGLPAEHVAYNDPELITILESVGLWQLFTAKDGLDTMVGESGLTLSGGQRQRLNFANLYLRAQYYKPALILIDEPTSSLDELSEKAITRMIDDLAQRAITFVIAHRLNTLEQAVGILDFSLIQSTKDILFYPTDELLKLSAYYRKLIKGEIELD